MYLTVGFFTVLLTLLAVIAIIMPGSYTYGYVIIEEFMSTIIMLVSLKFFLATYFDYFWILLTKRKYQFGNFHG